MKDISILENKKILIVDDEQDILETLKDLLRMCDIDIADDFTTGKKLLTENRYDIAILDIMGVDGYGLLELATQSGTPALMLTANALTPDNFVKSISQGADAYIPKEKMDEIDIFLSDFFKAQEGNGDPHKWYKRLKDFFDKAFGRNWLEKEIELQKLKDESVFWLNGGF